MKKILLIILAIIILVALAGIYKFNFTTKDYIPVQKYNGMPTEELNEILKDTPVEDGGETIKINEIEKEIPNGFSFNVNDPSIIHPFTKLLAEKKNKITEGEITDFGEEIFYEDDIQKIIRITSYFPGSTETFSYSYVHVKENSDLITRIFLDDRESSDEKISELILSLIPLYENKIKPTRPILQSPPGEIIEDGYYFAMITGWDLDNDRIEIDFVSVDNNSYKIKEDFDILFGTGEQVGNITLENSLENPRLLRISDNLFDGQEYLLGRISDEVFENDYYFSQYKYAPVFIYIEDETIIKLQEIYFAG